MKYIPPRGATNPNAAYINRNVTAGINGSVVDAAFFNRVQTEIMNVITGAGLAPSDANLSQLREAILAMIAAAIEGEEDPLPYVPLTREIETEEGVAGGGDLDEDLTLKLAIQTLTALLAADIADADKFLIYDASAAVHVSMTWAQLKVAIADALGGGGAISVPDVHGIGSYIHETLKTDDTKYALGVTGSATTGVAALSNLARGTQVAGASIEDGIEGTWRVHGAVPLDSGNADVTPGSGQVAWKYNSYLLLRIA